MEETVSVHKNNQSNLDRLITTCWGLSFITLLFPYKPVNSQSFLLLLVLSAALFFKKRIGWKLKFISFHLYYSIPFFVLLLSLLFISKESIAVMEKEAATICFPVISFLLLGANFSFSRKTYRALLVCFLSSVLFVLIFTSVRSFFYDDEFFAHNFLTFGIIHPSYFSFYCGVSILIILELSQERGIKVRLVAYLTIVCILIYMTLLSSRMPVISTIFVLLLSLFLSGSSIKKKLIMAAAFGILLATMTVIVYNSPRLKYRFIEAVQKNFDTRMVSWQAAIDVFKDHPLFGVGTGAGQPYLDNLYKIRVDNPEMYLDFNAHNYFLHSLMTFGVIGSLFILLFWYKLFSVAINYRGHLLLKTLILFLLCSTTEVMLATQKGIVFLYLFCSLNIVFLLKGANDISEKRETPGT